MAYFINFPTFLTIIRLVFSPLMLPILLVYFLPLNNLWTNCGLAFLFILFSITDFFDGYLARKYRQETNIGKILDPIADKALVYSTLIALLAIHKIFFYWVVILVGRDFFVMGLRLVACEHKITLHVSFLARLKTFLQMALLTYLIFTPYQDLGFEKAGLWPNLLEFSLLLITIFLSLISARDYYLSFVNQYQKTEDSKPFFEG